MAKLVLLQQSTRLRLVLVVLLMVPYAFFAWTARSTSDPTESVVQLFTDLGFELSIPVFSILLGTSTLGAWRRDESLVYLWLRKASRSSIVAGALLASIGIALLVNVVPVVVASIISAQWSPSLLFGGLHSVAWATMAYASMATALSLIVQRPFIVGLGFVLLWDIPISTVNNSLANLSISRHGTAILSYWAGVDTNFNGNSIWLSMILPVLLVLASGVFSIYRLNAMEVS